MTGSPDLQQLKVNKDLKKSTNVSSQIIPACGPSALQVPDPFVAVIARQSMHMFNKKLNIGFWFLHGPRGKHAQAPAEAPTPAPAPAHPQETRNADPAPAPARAQKNINPEPAPAPAPAQTKRRADQAPAPARAKKCRSRATPLRIWSRNSLEPFGKE